MSPTRNPTTRDIIGPAIHIPKNCITASDLRSLASSLDRLSAFHDKRGGRSPDDPCLVEVIVENDKTIHARVHSGKRVYHLTLVNNAWEFR